MVKSSMSVVVAEKFTSLHYISYSTEHPKLLSFLLLQPPIPPCATLPNKLGIQTYDSYVVLVSSNLTDKIVFQ